MKNKTKLTGLELNCIEVAVQHFIDELEDVLKERMDSNTRKEWKDKLWNLSGLIDDLEQSHYPVTAQQVAKFTDTYDHGDSDCWIADILNAEVNAPKLRHAIRNLDEKNPGDINYLYGKGV